MNSLPIDSTLCLIQGVAAAIALAKAKDQGTKILCGVLLAIDVAFAFGPYIGLEIKGTLAQVSCAAMAIIGVFAAIRVQNPILATLFVVSGCLLELMALGVVRGTMHV